MWMTVLKHSNNTECCELLWFSRSASAFRAAFLAAALAFGCSFAIAESWAFWEGGGGWDFRFFHKSISKNLETVFKENNHLTK
jgi:hypothetical protein